MRKEVEKGMGYLTEKWKLFGGKYSYNMCSLWDLVEAISDMLFYIATILHSHPGPTCWLTENGRICLFRCNAEASSFHTGPRAWNREPRPVPTNQGTVRRRITNQNLGAWDGEQLFKYPLR